MNHFGADYLAARFSIWEWGWKSNDPYDWFWLQPEIWAAVQYLADMNP